jgi:N-acetylglucosaminyl-diphospho-decaprenol L-rhamnosyltransferase
MQDLTAAVFLVDNGGSDGTVSWAREFYPWCQVIDSRLNGGYSFGNNLGLKAAGFPDQPRFRYALLLNPDTEIPPSVLKQMVDYLDQHADIGVLGPRLVLRDGSLDLACRRGEPTPETSFYYIFGLSRLFPRSPRFARYNMTFLLEDQTADVDSVVGACMLMRGSALAQARLMDEQFFMYGEDLDLNLRIKGLGYRVVYWPQAVVRHLKGTSTRKTPEKMIRVFYDAMIVFHRKHYAARYPAPFNWLVYGGIELVRQYKLLRVRMAPPDKRVVGSAKA